MDSVTESIMDILNDFPLLTGEFSFSLLAEDGGKAVFPLNGAAVESEIKDITGFTSQTICYPIMVVYRAGSLREDRKIDVKEWLDDLGRWLEGQPISDGTTTHRLVYPEMEEGKKWLSIKRQAPSYLEGVNENDTEDWAIAINCRYLNEF